jgi:hypothetical protein
MVLFIVSSVKKWAGRWGQRDSPHRNKILIATPGKMAVVAKIEAYRRNLELA